MGSPYYRLSGNEIDIIRSEINKIKLTLSHLEDELIDHLCCMVEGLISNGYTFEAAWKCVKKDIGMDSLRDIEIQTIIAINKKFNAMKKTLKISGIIGLSAIVISSILKINHWPGAGPLLVFGFVTLLLAYLPALSLTLRKEKILKRKMNLSYVGIFTAFILLLSLLFTIMGWPYREYLIYLSWIFMLIFLVMLFSNIMKSEENRVLNLSLLLFFSILFVINVTLSLTGLKNPRLSKFTIENNLNASIRLYERKAEKIYQQFDTISNTPHYNEIVEIKTKTNNVVLKAELIRDALFLNKTEQENFNKRLFKPRVISNNIESSSMKLGKEVQEYKEFMINKASLQPDLNSFIEKSIQFGPLEFNNNPSIIYNNLQKLIRDIRIAEIELLNEVIQSSQTNLYTQ